MKLQTVTPKFSSAIRSSQDILTASSSVALSEAVDSSSFSSHSESGEFSTSILINKGKSGD